MEIAIARRARYSRDRPPIFPARAHPTCFHEPPGDSFHSFRRRGSSRRRMCTRWRLVWCMFLVLFWLSCYTTLRARGGTAAIRKSVKSAGKRKVRKSKTCTTMRKHNLHTACENKRLKQYGEAKPTNHSSSSTKNPIKMIITHYKKA